jgi:glycosyltransferase involved in cell wall biosynthesis
LDPLGHPPLSLLFVGNFVHPPNVDAAMHMMNDIFPRVQKHCPAVVLYIVGDKPPPEVRRMASEQVVVTGFVADIVHYLNCAAVVVAPLRLGGGMRVKVLEALAHGKAVVASPLAVNGLNVVNGEQVVLAQGEQQFGEAILQLLWDEKRRSALARRARAWALANFDWQRTIDAYEALYTTLLNKS